eukprot:scaffold20.g7672.t1
MAEKAGQEQEGRQDQGQEQQQQEQQQLGDDDGSPASGNWVRSDEDAWHYFSQGWRNGREFFYARGTEDTSCGGVPMPSMDLVVISEAEALRRRDYVTLSTRELIFVGAGGRTEAVAAAEYRRLKAVFAALHRIPFFGRYLLAKHYRLWAAAVKARRFRRMRAALGAALLRGSPAFCAPLGALQAALHALSEVDACGAAAGALLQRRSVEEFAAAAAGWRADAAGAVSELVGDAVRAAEAACAAAEAAAAAARASIADESELTDRIGVDLYAATTAARAKSMWTIRCEKAAKARAYHRAVAEAGKLPRLVRLVDLLLGSALAQLVAGSCQGATAALRLGATGGEGEGEAGGGGEPRKGGRPPAGVLVSTVGFGELGAGSAAGPVLAPGESEWLAALMEQLLEGSLALVAGVPAVASLPAFRAYALPGVERRGPDAIARADPAVQSATTALRVAVHRSFSQAAAAAGAYTPQREVRDFLAAWDGDAYVAAQRASLDLAGVQAQLMRLLRWQAALAAMPAGDEAGRVYVDAEPLRGALAPGLAAATERLAALLLELGRAACREQVEDLGRRLAVLAARPGEPEDFAAWAGEAARCAGEKERSLAAVALVDAIYAALAEAGAKLPTADAVRLDDLHEAAARLGPELERCAAFLAEERPRHATAAAAASAALEQEAILLEDALRASATYWESLSERGLQGAGAARAARRAVRCRAAQRKRRPTALPSTRAPPPTPLQHGVYVDPSGAPAEVLAELELAGAQVRQLEAGAADLRGLAASLGAATGACEGAVAAAGREQRRRAAEWELAGDLAALLVGWEAEAAAGRGAGRREGTGGDSREGELLPLEERLAELEGAEGGGHAAAMLAHLRALAAAARRKAEAA